MSSSLRVLIDASNITVGGTLQVAASLIDELHALSGDAEVTAEHPWLRSATYLVSAEVAANLTGRTDTSDTTVSTQRWWHPKRWLHSTKEFDLQLVIWGPRYGARRAPVTVAGIADVTSIYQWPMGVPPGSVPQRLKRAIRGIAARRQLSRESFLISESAALLQAFHERTGYDLANSAVVPNTVNRAVSDPALRQRLPVDLREGLSPETRLLAYPARLYPHKNHTFLPPVRSALRELGMDVKFAVTLTDAEWDSASPDLRDACVNAGIIPVNHMANLYEQCEGLFFPSLLESFSATPIEGLLINGVALVSDRPFVKDVCGEYAVYFDPLNPRSAAQAVHGMLSAPDEYARLQAAGRAFAQAELTTARDRAMRYVETVSEVGNQP